MIPSTLFDPERLDPGGSGQTDPVSGSKQYAEQVVGAAVFDLNGLPEAYFIAIESSDIIWVQTVFQVLGLQSLLLASFKLDDFQHTIIRGQEVCVIIVRQCDRYIALLLQDQPDFSLAWMPALIKWAQQFDPAVLEADPRFNPI